MEKTREREGARPTAWRVTKYFWFLGAAREVFFLTYTARWGVRGTALYS